MSVLIAGFVARRSRLSSPITRANASQSPTRPQSSFESAHAASPLLLNSPPRKSGSLVAPWDGDAFDVLIYGRPEGMTLEHCVLSAAFDRVVTTCRDLCVQKHTNVELTDPAGYKFPVATDSACRNRPGCALARDRRIGVRPASLAAAGSAATAPCSTPPMRRSRKVIAGYRALLDSLSRNERADTAAVRALVGDQFTPQAIFSRAV